MPFQRQRQSHLLYTCFPSTIYLNTIFSNLIKCMIIIFYRWLYMSNCMIYKNFQAAFSDLYNMFSREILILNQTKHKTSSAMQLHQIIWYYLPLFRIWVCIFAIHLLIHKDWNGKLSFSCPHDYLPHLLQILAQISLSF